MTALLKRLQTAVAGRYAVEQEIGRGGMATVFLGTDLKLERRVAIKVFERADGAAASSERFLREIRIAAQLQHPNILPVFESGDGEDLVYYVMPYVAGASVRERIEREGPLPIADAIRIAREVAEALDHAHRAGIVHRDIKPDNIMLADGVAVVADFGIAKAIEEGGSGRVTETGLAVGTPTYMSPEQAAAQPQVDGRTDIYALGCVLYEMLTGSPPFSGATGQQVMARHATDPVPPVRTVRPVPVGLESVVTKALAKVPGDRFATGKAMAEALAMAAPTTSTPPVQRRSRVPMWFGVSAGVVLSAVAAWKFVIRDPASAAEAPIRSMAVLAFDVRGDTGLLKYADGFTERVTNGLTTIKELSVRPPGRALALRGKVSDPQAAGRTLDAENVLAGSLEVAGRTLRFTVSLVNVADGFIRWSTTFDAPFTNDRLFEMQDSLTVQLVDALRLRMAPKQRAGLARGESTKDSLAYDLYLRARRMSYSFVVGEPRRAVALLEQAVARDSMFADAWLAIADAGEMGGLSHLSPAEEALVKRKAVARAIALNTQNGLAYALRAWDKLAYEWDWAAARADFDRALTLSPSSTISLEMLALYYNAASAHDSALMVIRRAAEIDPTDPFILGDLGRRYAFAGWDPLESTCRHASLSIL